MSFYQGRALRTEPRVRRGGGGRIRRILTLLAALGLAAIVAQVPWGLLRQRVFDVREIRVDGARYLEPAAVTAASGLKPGADLFGVDLDRARQALLLQPRIAAARISRRPPHTLSLHIEERTPVLLVEHGVPWELDSAGVLLPPLAEGVVADVPMLVGMSVQSLPAGTQVHSPAVERGLAWVRALGARDLQLAGQISELDISDADCTVLTLMSGTRVLSPAWPPGIRSLSALRVVLADLQQRGTMAQEVDLRYENQVIVRPVEGKAGGPARTS
jgi:cell division protein FtsQ